MSKQLWSINAIASELDRDRRTVTAALAGVPADGTIKGNKAWFMDSAVRALSRHGSNDAEQVPESRMLEHFTHRVVDFEELQSTIDKKTPRGQVVDFQFATDVFADGKVDALLVWLKAGLPYWKEGNWDTGEGFEFIAHWILDFKILVGREIRTSGDRRAARILHMTDALP